MEWYWVFSAIIGAFLILLALGVPVFLAFTIIDVVGIYLFWGGVEGVCQFIHSVFSSISSFVLLPVPLFILMGEIIGRSGIFNKAIESLDKWMGHVGGRLCLIAIAGATIFAALSGSAMGTTAMLAAMLMPEMEKRGYNRTFALGSCFSGALAMIIPPSALAVILATLADLSVGKVLIGGVLPGLVLSLLYSTYIVISAKIKPSLAPDYSPMKYTMSDTIISFSKYVLPFGSIIFVVTGLIILGLATPTESAAMGVLASCVLTAIYGQFNLKLIKESLEATLRITVMMFMILTGALAFGQILAYTGASKGLVEFVVSAQVSPFVMVLIMQALLVFLGALMEQVSIMMITFPVFMPLVKALDIDPLWFGICVLVNMGIAMKTPPFGLCLFVMKGVAPKGTSMAQIYRAVFPYIVLDLIGLLVLLLVPTLCVILPSLMRY